MDELEIRRLYISDEEWERTSESWKALKPFRNFNQIRQTDETEQKYFERLQPQYKIPIEVMKQWIYPHYYDRNTVNNYGWLNYTSSAFQLEEFTVEMILQLNIIKDNRQYVESRASVEVFEGFCCLPHDLEHWQKYSTWRVPPIVLDVDRLKNIPAYAELKGHFQLIEGHSRLGYFLAMEKKKIRTLRERTHQIYVLKPYCISA
jgi:hypothetical protein